MANQTRNTEEGYITVRTTVLGKITEKFKTIKIRPFVSESARFAIGRRFSQEIRQGAWATTEVRVEVPCYPEELKGKAIRTQVREILEEVMTEEIREIEETQKGETGKESSEEWDED